MSTAEAAHAHAEGHDHDHPSWLAHHFETPEQQFDAGKLGIWLFLAQEVLFFAGLFVAYAVYRANHPQVFVDAHIYLNKTLGALNTIVLLASSLAVAWGVRAAQLNQQKHLLWLHIFTLACAGFFMGVKVVEYSYKFDEGLFWASWYSPKHLVEGQGFHTQFAWVYGGCLVVGGLMTGWGWTRKEANPYRGWAWISLGATVLSVALGTFSAAVIQANTPAEHGEHAATSHEGGGHAEEAHAEGAEPTESAAATPAAPAMVVGGRPVNQGNFFSIYFAMTGVHALHIFAGILAITWIVARIARGDFGPERFGPVEYVGLYWHLVDLVWIFLFPLLYLIH